jgi:lactoylglutathione lyase
MVKINLIVIKTNAIAMIKQQYEALGIVFDYHNHNNGPFHYAATLDGLIFEIYPLPNNTTQPDTTLRLGFEVPHLEDILQKLALSHWKIITEITLTPYGKIAIIEDHDGRKVELKQQ